MSGFGSKTAVSCLQEYLVSKKMIPDYELIHTNKSQGPHKPEFTFRVQAGGLSEEGTGRSKQAAKHQAAEKMLRSLKVISHNIVKEEISELDLGPDDNYVGQLKDLCHSQHYPDPKYEVEEEGGPPHSRIFKMVCYVSKLEEFGIDKSKKRAKQQAAFKMIQRLKEVGGKKVEEALAHPESPIRIQNKSMTTFMNDKEVIEKYQALRSTSAPVELKDNAAFYKDHYKAYVGLQENSPTLAKVIEESHIISLENSLRLLKEIAQELGASVSTGKIPNRKGADFVVMTMSVIPPIGDVGSSEGQAAFNLLNSFLYLCSN